MFGVGRPGRGRREPRARLGERGERLAAAHLAALGYRLVATNFRVPLGHSASGRAVIGEIDLVAYDGAVLTFVEVKTRRREGLFAAQSAVGERKRRLLTRAARRYRRLLGVTGEPYRFDVVTVLLARGEAPRVRLLRGYFEGGPAVE
jgi:putative endonuclease